MPGDANIVYRSNPDAKQQAHDAIFAGIRDVFELDIKPEAQQNTPVLTGNNRRSIDTEVTQTEQGTVAQLFTQSGYGGYIETGTHKMKAQPYLWPAVVKFIGKIQALVGTNFGLAQRWEGPK